LNVGQGNTLTQAAVTQEYLWRRAQEELYREDFAWWAEHANLRLDGNPFTFGPDHAYLEEIYEAMSDPGVTTLVLEKAAQMGLTVGEVLFSFWGMKHRRFPKGVLYLLPSEHHMQRVSKTKLQPIIDENPVLQAWVTDTDSSAQKRIGQASLILHGMNTTLGLKSYSVDCVVFDEVEEITDWTNVPLAEERMSHSKLTWKGRTIEGGVRHYLSVPSVPEYGIDALFKGKRSDDSTFWEVDPSDQRYWHLKCEHCGEYTCLEDEFPECLVEVSAKEEKAIRVCKKCRRELDPAVGQWVAKRPDQHIRGYHISQLFSAYVNPWKLLDQFRRKKDFTNLYNDKLGIAYIQADARIEVQEVLSLCGSTYQLSSFEGPAAMGVDQPDDEGGKFHIVICYKSEKVPCTVVMVCIRNKWAEVAQLMDLYNVARCVVDGLPDKAKALTFANDFSGKVYLNFYAENQKGIYRWNDDDSTVSVDRTEALDESNKIVHERKVLLPMEDDDILLFAKHCHNMARTSERNEHTEVVRHVWKRTGPDHFRHAFTYSLIALGEVGEYVPPKKEKDWLRARKGRAQSWRTV